MDDRHADRHARILANEEFRKILRYYDHEVFPMIGIPSGWEEIAAWDHACYQRRITNLYRCSSANYLKLWITNASQYVEARHDWRVAE